MSQDDDREVNLQVLDGLRREAFLCARGERLAELRGRRLRRFDDAGLHPFSFIMGKIALMEQVLDLPPDDRSHPVRIKDEALADAHQIMLREINDGTDPFDPKARL